MAAAVQTQPFAIESFLALEETKDLLRFSTAGSVDDGKSTLIGRLLFDSQNVYEDQIHAVKKASIGRSAGVIDFSLLTDGLRAEREQGITIDVAYRYFATARRKFIIADTPGHEQYTRNMATGASTADLAIILIDARKGVLPQSRRHAFIASLLGIRHFVVAVNKMDLVDYSLEVFSTIQADFRAFLGELQAPDAWFVPISALLGDNVVDPSRNMPWFDGPSLLEHLETVEVEERRSAGPFRLAVQRVIRPDQHFRGYAGQVASGVVRPGDRVVILPSGRTSEVKAISTFDGDLPSAQAPMSIALTLEDDVDISRGDLIASAGQPPVSARRFEATVVWMGEQPLDTAKTYLLKHTTQMVVAEVKSIAYRVDVRTLRRDDAATLEMNSIGLVQIETGRSIFLDPYSDNRTTGCFILIDRETNGTVGAGMIGRALADERKSRALTIRVGPDIEEARDIRRQLAAHGYAVVILESNEEAAAGALERAGFITLLLAEIADPAERWRDLLQEPHVAD